MNKDKVLLLALVMGLLLRFAFVFWHPYPDANDARQYDTIAENIVKGHGISQDINPPYTPEIDRVPFYPIFMAFFYFIFGHHLIAVRIAQAVLSLITALFAYLIARRIAFQGRLSSLPVLSAAFNLLCPFLIIFVSILFTETLDTFLITLALLLFIYGISSGKKVQYFFSGAAMGLAFLTRPEAFAFPLLLSAALLLVNLRNPRQAIKYAGIFLLPFFLLWGAWIARNYFTFHKFVPITTQDAALLLIGTYPPNRYEKDFPKDIKDEYIKFRFVPEKERIGVVIDMRKRAIQRILDQPLLYIAYCLQRIPILWVNSYAHYIGIDTALGDLARGFISGVKGHKESLRSAGQILIKSFLYSVNIFYLVTGLWGIILLMKYWLKIYPLYLALVYFTLIHLPLGDASPRYVVKILPVLLIFSAAGALNMYSRSKNRIYSSGNKGQALR